MNVVDIITRKKDGCVLSAEEIGYMVNGFTDGDIPDYQMSAFLMAVVLNGMSKEETVELTKIMRDSGDVMDLSAIEGIKVDKHSTGGVGDKTTLIVAPIAAACGVPIAKMSGRGLGFTGGTVDKMESIPGFRTSMEKREFVNAVNSRKIAVIGQSGNLTPADKKMYALRDVTGTTQSLSLITSSIMSKKLAAGSDAILLDVKCGSGAFMKNEEDALQLAQWMVDIGNSSGRKTMALISDMNQPLGNAVGNAVEVTEAISVLRGEGADDITTLSMQLAGAMIALGEKTSLHGKMQDAMNEGVEIARKAIADGSALDKFKEFVSGQGGNSDIVDNVHLMPQPAHLIEVRAEESGYVIGLDALTVGLASQHAGAGRETKHDVIDMSAGIHLNKKVGDYAEKGDILCRVFGNDSSKLEMSAEEVMRAYKFGRIKPATTNIIKKIVE